MPQDSYTDVEEKLARAQRELSEALEQQAATAEVLRIIASSPGELQPVFQAMLANATRICEANFGILYRFDGHVFHAVALQDAVPAYGDYLRREPPRADPRGALGRLLKTKHPVHISDITAEPAYTDIDRDPARVATVEIAKARTFLAVPMLKENELVGAIGIYRQEVRPFTDKHIALVASFASQAVIAIENTRLLNELRESLRQQTATAEVLKTISRRAFDLQRVLETLLENAVRICGAKHGMIYRYDGECCRAAAAYDAPPGSLELWERTPIRAGRGTTTARVLLERRPVQIPDVLADPEYDFPEAQKLMGIRTTLAVPLLREGVPLGTITLWKTEVAPFTDKQIELLTTFADQAAIAIENARLFDEVQARTRDLSESLQQQTATADVLKVISRSAFDLRTVLNTLVESAARLCEADSAAVHRPKGDAYPWIASYGYSHEYDQYMRDHPIVPGRGSVLGRAVLDGRTVHIADVEAETDYALVEQRSIGGYRTVLGVPLMREGIPIGVIMLTRNMVRPFTEKQIELVTTFADQAVIAIENVRLFDEIQDKSRQLAEASQHKSQFLANMSHELRTPLNAILGYTELILDSVYGEMPAKARSVLDRVQRNGRHLLGLINDVLDLSKIEAGQLILSLSDYSLKNVIQTVFSAVEPLASEKQIALKIDVAPELPQGRGDERRLTQVLLNLVGNAIKFTDVGEVSITGSSANGSFKIAVRDTGPGISTTDQAKLFQEFQQADNSITKKKGGTGLGLAISRRIIEMHGGRIWVESNPGHGSTFAFTVPTKVEQQVGPS